MSKAELVKTDDDFTYWDDGTIRYASGNSLGKRPGGIFVSGENAAKPFTSETALVAQKRREELYLEATEEGVADAMKTETAPEAWKEIVKGQAELAPNDTKAARFVGEELRTRPDKKATQQQAQQIVLSFEGEPSAEFLRAVRSAGAESPDPE